LDLLAGVVLEAIIIYFILGASAFIFIGSHVESFVLDFLRLLAVVKALLK